MQIPSARIVMFRRPYNSKSEPTLKPAEVFVKQRKILMLSWALIRAVFGLGIEVDPASLESQCQRIIITLRLSFGPRIASLRCRQTFDRVHFSPLQMKVEEIQV